MNNDYNYAELESIMLKRSLTWADVVRKIDAISERTVYTAKYKSASRSTMKHIAKALRVSIDRLIIETDETKEEVAK